MSNNYNTYVTDRVLSSDFVEEITNKITHLVTPTEQSMFGIDGITYGIDAPKFGVNRVKWWCKLQNEFKQLEDFHASTVGLLDSKLPEHKEGRQFWSQ